MKVLYSPQFNDIDTLEYEFDNDKVIATVNGETDTFDLSDIPEEFTTSLKHNPIISARYIDGELHVTLLQFITDIQSEHIPKWEVIDLQGGN